MWDKLLALFKDKQADEIQSTIPEVSKTVNNNQFEASPVHLSGRSIHLGYNYLKGMDGENEDSSKHIRRFINLNKLLRGKYNGKIEASHAEPEGDLRGEDAE